MKRSRELSVCEVLLTLLAECLQQNRDVCVTSSNVYSIVEAIPNQKIYFLPDKLMGKNIEKYLIEKGEFILTIARLEPENNLD